MEIGRFDRPRALDREGFLHGNVREAFDQIRGVGNRVGLEYPITAVTCDFSFTTRSCHAAIWRLMQNRVSLTHLRRSGT
jgi:hypothetical protein